MGKKKTNKNVNIVKEELIEETLADKEQEIVKEETPTAKEEVVVEEEQEIVKEEPAEIPKDLKKVDAAEIRLAKKKVAEKVIYTKSLCRANSDIKTMLETEGSLTTKNYNNNSIKKEMNYFMKKNFEWFSVNGSLLTHRGTLLGRSGSTVPTGGKYIVCTVEQFADIISCVADGVNFGTHKASFEDKNNKKWYKKQIDRFNIYSFLMDYINNKISKASNSPMNEESKARLLAVAEKYKKYDLSPKESKRKTSREV